MINVNTMYTYVQNVVNQAQGTGYLRPDDFNTFANLAVQEKITRDFRIYQDTQKVSDDLKTFIPKVALQTTLGLLPYPDDYWYFVAARMPDLTLTQGECPPDYNNVRQIAIKPLDSDQIAWRLGAPTAYRPSVQNPIAEFIDTGIQVYPSEVNTVNLEYVRQPATVVWAYTAGGNGLPVYDSANSTNFEHGMQCFNELMLTICQYFGVNVRERELIEDAAAFESKGG